MKPPKRSPFLHSRQASLLEIYRHLYRDSPFVPSNTSSAMDRHKALSTVQVWINRSACPFAVETTALLVQSVILDEHMQQIAASSSHGGGGGVRYALEQMGGGAELGVRLNYSLAIARFVNSVVDSHQTGGFAQSIAAIAARIGLPLWFVEIRHAVTHEELPSIGVCRQAAVSALAWLRRHFWIPQLFQGANALNLGGVQGNDSVHANAMDLDASEHRSAQVSSSSVAGTSGKATASEEEETRTKDRRTALQDLRVTLRRYRQLAKQVARDRSLANTCKDEFRRLYKQCAGFVAKIRTLEPEFATQLIDSKGGFKGGKDGEVDVRGVVVIDPDDVDECTKSALSDLVNQLVQPGGLIPLNKSKRVSATASGESIVLPAEVARVWTPLLGYLRDMFGPIFGQLLTEELMDAVLHNPDSTPLSADASAAPTPDDADTPSSQHWKALAYSSGSYRKTCEAWMRYLVTTIPPSAQPALANATRNTAPAALISDVEVAEMCLPMRCTNSTGLLEFLCSRNDELNARIGALVAVVRVSSFVTKAHMQVEDVRVDDGGFEGELAEMQKRLDQMECLDWSSTSAQQTNQAHETTSTSTAANESSGTRIPYGWSVAGPDWKPTPFGCLEGKIPNLVLDV